jgi:hypothetical protein
MTISNLDAQKAGAYLRSIGTLNLSLLKPFPFPMILPEQLESKE